QQGIVPRSADLVASAALFALVGALLALGARFVQAFAALLTAALGSAAAPVPPGIELLAGPASDVAWLALVVLLAIAAAAGLADVAQVGPLFAPAGVAPDLGRIDPAARLRALFSAQHWLDAGFAAVKASALLAIAAWTLFDARHALRTLGSGGAERALFVLGA